MPNTQQRTDDRQSNRPVEQVGKDRNFKICPRNQRQDHQHKCQRKNDGHCFSCTGKFWHIAHIERRRNRWLRAIICLVFASFHLLGVAHRKGDRCNEPKYQDNSLDRKYVCKLHIRRLGCDTRRKRIDRRTKHADATTEHDNHHGSHSIVPRRQHDRYNQRIKRHRFFLHAVGRSADRKQQHQNRNQPDFPALHLIEQ